MTVPNGTVRLRCLARSVWWLDPRGLAPQGRNGSADTPEPYWNDLENSSSANLIIGYIVEYESNPIPAPSALVGLVSMGIIGAFGYVCRRRRNR